MTFRRSRRAIPLLVLLLLGPVAACVHAAPLRALLLSGQNNHDWRSTTPFLERQLEATGRFDVDVTNEPGTLTLADFRRYDVLVSNYNGDAWSETTNAAFLQYLTEGGGLVVIHAADNAFPGWAEWESLIGCAWRAGTGHGAQHRYVVTLTRPDHPILRGIPHYLHAQDELYHKLLWAPDSQAEVIGEAYSRPDTGGTGAYEPMLIVNTWGRGRMFHTAMGHDNASLGDPRDALILARGAEWAATGRVTIPVPPDLPRDVQTGGATADGTAASWQALGLDAALAERIASAATPAETAKALADAIAAGDGAARVAARQQIVGLGLDALAPLLALYRERQELRMAAGADLQVVAGLASRDREAAKAVAAWAGPLLFAGAETGLPQVITRMLGLAGSPVAIDALKATLADRPLTDEELQAVVAFAGGEQSRQEVLAGLAAVDSGEALEALGRIPGSMATAALVQYLREAPAASQPKVLEVLAERGDVTAVKRIAEAARSQDVGVAAAAVRALGALTGEEAIEALADALHHEQPLVKACAAISLLEQARALAEAGTPEAALVAVRAVLAASPSDADASAAARVLGAVNTTEAFSLLRDLAESGAPSVRIAAAEALGAITATDPEPTLLVLTAAPSEDLVRAVLPVLGDRGTAAAIDRLSAICHDERRSMEVRAAAATAIGRAPNKMAVNALLKLVDAWSPDAVHAAAFAALLGVGRSLAATDPAAACDSARWLCYTARTSSQKAQGLHLAGDAYCDRTVGLFHTVVRNALTELTGDDLAGAAHAAVAVATGLLEEGKTADLESLCLLVLEKAPGEPYARQIAEKLAQSGSTVSVAALQGFVTRWQIIGPFANDNGDAFETAYPPEERIDLGATLVSDGRELTWKAFESADALGRVNLREVVAPRDNVVAYAFAEITAPAAMDALVKLGSDDGIVAWVNGEKVHALDAARPVTVDQDVVRVHLEPGANALLLKILQGSGDWGFCCRVTDTDGHPLRAE